jgi:hypothetical protein
VGGLIVTNEFVDQGGRLAYGPSVLDLYRRAPMVVQ